MCQNFGQLPQFTGEWVDHPDPAYAGLYKQEQDCPAWGRDFDCSKAATAANQTMGLVVREYRKVFKPYECELPTWDALAFDR